jgi:hypothetical protein
MKHRNTALALLLVGMALSYGWQWAPEELMGTAWNITTSVLVILLLALLGLVLASPEIWLVAALLAVFKLVVITCDVWYAVAPWPVKPGQALCSARLNLPLGVVGLFLGVVLAAAIYRGKP